MVGDPDHPVVVAVITVPASPVPDNETDPPEGADVSSVQTAYIVMPSNGIVKDPPPVAVYSMPPVCGFLQLKNTYPDLTGVGAVTIQGLDAVFDVGETVPPFAFQLTVLLTTGADTLTSLAFAEFEPPSLEAVTTHVNVVP